MKAIIRKNLKILETQKMPANQTMQVNRKAKAKPIMQEVLKIMQGVPPAQMKPAIQVGLAIQETPEIQVAPAIQAETATRAVPIMPVAVENPKSFSAKPLRIYSGIVSD